MKIKDLLEGRWVAKSPDGRERRFKDPAEADSWRAGTHPGLTPKQKAFKSVSAYLDWAEKEEAKLRPKKPSSWELWSKFQDAVSSTFPDGDPLDRLGPWMRQHELTIHDLDAAVKEHGDHESAHDYMAQIWADHSADAEHDAMQGHLGDTYDDQWFQRPNPWK